MRICFICGSLQPGKDGVGDYTRRLACELVRLGNDVKIISINDKYTDTLLTDLQKENDTSVDVLRLPHTSSWDERFKTAGEYILLFQPEWISLQFVLFIFNRKGLPFGLANKVKKLNGGSARWHIMFHELWAGMNREAPIKLKIIGLIQNYIIKSFLLKIKPSVIHTHAQVYQWQLRKMKFNVKPLSLFNNLSIDIENDKAHNDVKENRIEKNTIVFALFGNIHPDAPVEQFAEEMRAYGTYRNKKIKIKILGRAGSQQTRWIDGFTAKRIDINAVGELSSEQVTQELFSSDYGISTTPWLLAGKSSAIATMLGHGLPVLCVSKTWNVSGMDEAISSPDIFNYQKGNLETILETNIDEVTAFALSDVSRQFFCDIASFDK